MSGLNDVLTGYESKLGLIQTEIAIKKVKDYFENKLSEELNLTKVSAPLLLNSGTGINDNLNGVERIVTFNSRDLEAYPVEVVQSLAKWKRIALAKYGFEHNKGLYADMNAIRSDEQLDNMHSMYVDQWDWEKIISKEQRNLSTLRHEVKKIYSSIKSTECYLNQHYPQLEPVLPEEIFFISTQELEDLYPKLSPKERENKIAEQHGAVFISQIGGLLKSGDKHDGRAPDYDDWTLNGDIIFWSTVLNQAFEVSSMGIRVDEHSLITQLKKANKENHKHLKFQKAILNGELPYTIGGGIGQSRLCMFLLKKAHIGEVQASVWNNRILEECQKLNIQLL